jgi:hypothetical protein
VARTIASSNGSPDKGGRRTLEQAIKREFLAREIVIDCPSSGCSGKFLTERREINRPSGTGARVVLRCTRQPEEHEVTLSMDPLTVEEADALKSSLVRGESLACVRCGDPLELGSVESPDGWAKSVNSQAVYHCPWCGVKWVPPVETKRRAS